MIPIMPTLEQSILGLILPPGVMEWFDIIAGTRDDNQICIVLEEKNLPPLASNDKDKKVISKGFKEITVTDFPIRGRRTLLTFRRRYWQIEGQKELLKRDIPLCFPGTQLETEFANFLKEDDGRSSGLAEFYRRVASSPGQRI
jgi:hypothetical protein